MTWKEGDVRAVVFEEDVDAILNIIIPINGRDDMFRWPHTKDGKLSVRSAYYHIQDGGGLTQGNTNNQPVMGSTSLWMTIWSTKVWLKIKAFVWRLATNTLETKDNLVR